MALKTQVNKASVPAFLNAIADAERRKDAKLIAGLMRAATNARPKMWGTSIVGFGEREYVYANGKTAIWMQLGFSPRKQALTLYMPMAGQWDGPIIAKLGKYSRSGGCLHIKRLSDVSIPTLKKLIGAAAKASRKRKDSL